MEVFPGFLLLLFFTAHNTFCKPLEDEEAGKMLLNEGQFIVTMTSHCVPGGVGVKDGPKHDLELDHHDAARA